MRATDSGYPSFSTTRKACLAWLVMENSLW